MTPALAEKVEDTMADQYGQFSSDYHWMYSDDVLSGEPFLDPYRDLLSSLPPAARILDCSCGIGVHAIALARLGFSVKGVDSSAGMVAQARERSNGAGLDLSFTVSTWKELPWNLEVGFDMAFCVGNSIGHCVNANEMVSSFRGIRWVLKESGLLVIDSRNWAKVRAERPRFTVLGVRERDGVRCIPLYAWNLPLKWDEEHVIEVVLIFEEAGKVHVRHYPITYHPFEYADLCERLERAGFKIVESSFEKQKDLYSVIARNG